MVKDLRTDFEVGNPQAVFDGDIDGFLEAGIRWRRGAEAAKACATGCARWPASAGAVAPRPRPDRSPQGSR
jgi:hypothetical protein